jgi:hypothetical protein
VAVEVIMQAASARALSNLLAATGGEIRELGANELEEGIIRKIAAAAVAEESIELAEAGVDLAVQGAEELAAGEELESAARDIAADGVAQEAVGAAEIGAAAAEDAVAEEMD